MAVKILNAIFKIRCRIRVQRYENDFISFYSKSLTNVEIADLPSISFFTGHSKQFLELHFDTRVLIPDYELSLKIWENLSIFEQIRNFDPAKRRQIYEGKGGN